VGKVSKALNKAGSTQTQDSSQVSSSHRLYEEEPETAVVESRSTSTPDSTAQSHRPDPGNIKKWDERLAYSTDKLAGVAEGIRKLRSMLLQDDSFRTTRSIMVLSSDPQEGKSFVCANLGISFANSVEHQALLVDCDLRRPSLHKLFGIPPRKGLAEYLDHGGDFAGLITGTGMAKLSVIPAGTPPNNPAELLSSSRMSELMENLSGRNRNRLIILDTPPFFAASETLLLSRLVDKVVLVVRWGKAGRENVRKMVETIGREKIIGTVFNAFEMNILDRRIQGVGYNNYYPQHY
jgi:protein-tyrosine kinase